ncbi:MAG: chloramphenicol phosphotransferase [Actinomycetota bacterium]|nr:chloramphenicol phosphotransferase [Actinomycetota bacterium]
MVTQGDGTGAGSVVILNGAPRAGKSSIARALQERWPTPLVNLGVDLTNGATPAAYRPGMGLRPGGERPDLEDLVARLYRALYDSVAAHCRHGLDVVVDVGHHDAYARPLGTLADAARRLEGLGALLVGVRCPLEVIMARRDAGGGGYARSGPGGEVPEPVRRWQREVHRPGIYDLEVDTSVMTPDECAERVLEHLGADRPPTALARLRAGA